MGRVQRRAVRPPPRRGAKGACLGAPRGARHRGARSPPGAGAGPRFGAGVRAAALRGGPGTAAPGAAPRGPGRGGGASGEYQYVVVNDDVVDAVARVAAILDVEARRVARLSNLGAVIDDLRRDLAGQQDRLRGDGAAGKE